jgi:hypothetical protein
MVAVVVLNLSMGYRLILIWLMIYLGPRPGVSYVYSPGPSRNKFRIPSEPICLPRLEVLFISAFLPLDYTTYLPIRAVFNSVGQHQCEAPARGSYVSSMAVVRGSEV